MERSSGAAARLNHLVAGHAGIVQRVLEGQAPANILALLRQTFGLTYDSWGKDAFGGEYPWLARERR